MPATRRLPLLSTPAVGQGHGVGVGMHELAVIGGPLRAIARCRDRRRSVAAAVVGVAWLIAVLAGAPDSDAAPAVSAPSIGGCQNFPDDNVWNTRIDALPVHARSDAW